MQQHNSETFRISMRDIDLHGHVHNSVYLDYFEDAVVNAFRRYHLLPLFRPQSAGVAYHVKKCEATFHHPLTVDDEVMPLVAVEKLGNSSLVFSVQLLLADKSTLCAEGKLIWVCVNPRDHKPCPIPDETRAALRQHLPFTAASA
ncbi:acyl-CoA thioesterase [Erwinia amylovora]|uniref:Acyl-CoA thioester hydrolase ybgC n=3 Tax=Erwinia amylovora TaxID=552 RepID=A0A831ETJ0_ERWAM|nr:thioesterase family protein [Erwinia amylovora]CDK16210.1 Acyl-CoA thioester hydrolase ybgC (EC 3,1.2.-) [Erwinia amylovora LA635]CDK19576.1 Acyl-CoA thioester hydrolase ybgC (EC 3,1.2.-) [Erwinia amylovora LA636]CDK22948.1 Acyl-CoA thioester hydrolase ybgC (EC 3,1.2.-) [Erwinia amylovora LA637]ATZ10666.1 acyl-CoA thioesterase [Erwinia amylovora]EKV52846.1 Acyl-CoA thioester hydrolase ybgC [Erwinia amylovora ACW56400]